MKREMSALRFGIGLCRHTHQIPVRISGEHAFELVDAVSPRALFVRDGQMLPTVFLNDDGSIFADVYVCADDLDFVLLVEGPEVRKLLAYLRRAREPDWEVEITDLSESHALLGVHGPFAWELLSVAVGPEVVGVGYLRSFLMFEVDGICFRAGKTGEFGYEILVANTHKDALWSTLCSIGARFDAVELSLQALDLAALQNGFFSMRHGTAHHTPVELQLLWRLTLDRAAPGMDSVRQRIIESTHRMTWFVAEHEPEDVCTSLPCPLLGGVVGQVLLPVHEATVGVDTGGYRTVAPPILRNRSLFIDAQRHSWAGREVDEFPTLLVGRAAVENTASS